MTIVLWGSFIAFVLAMLAIDLGVLHREPREIGFKEALRWTVVCAAIALAFNVLVYFLYEHHWLGVGITIGQPLSGIEAAEMYLAGWLLEQSLSVDNIFVIALVFRSYRVPAAWQHRVLFWGVLGALVMRGVMIGVGTALLRQFSWITYVFGAFLIWTALKLLLRNKEDDDPQKTVFARVARKLFRVTEDFREQRFFERVDGKLAVTPLFLALLVVECMDVVFAVDSIPAVLAITTDPFLVFTSNVFAILSLRSLFFAVAAMLDRLHYLETSLAGVLAFVGVKMLLGEHYKIPTHWSLAVIFLVLAAGAAASWLRKRG